MSKVVYVGNIGTDFETFDVHHSFDKKYTLEHLRMDYERLDNYDKQHTKVCEVVGYLYEGEDENELEPEQMYIEVVFADAFISDDKKVFYHDLLKEV